VRVGFFTAGTRGAGHVMRGIALKRALDRAGFRGDYIMIGPTDFEPPVTTFAQAAGFVTVAIEEELLRSPERASSSSDLAAKIHYLDLHLLIVDMFWAPVRHVLPLKNPRAEAWLLLRSFPPSWLEGPDSTLLFDPMQYARIITIEPGLRTSAFTHAVDPVVGVTREERKPKGALRERLGIATDQHLIGVMHAGRKGEIERLLDVAEALKTKTSKRERERSSTIVRFDLFDGDRALFPIASWLSDCDAIVSGAGYNAFWEAHTLGYADRTTFVPFERSIDDQPRRIATTVATAKKTRSSVWTNGADTIASWIVERARDFSS
jgi:hypothetical protein